MKKIFRGDGSTLKADIENINKCLPINKLYSQSVSAHGEEGGQRAQMTRRGRGTAGSDDTERKEIGTHV